MMERFLFMLLCGVATTTIAAQIPAFPRAEGFGAISTSGGRGGTVYYGTTLYC